MTGNAAQVKSSQELPPVGQKAPRLSRRCAFANHNPLVVMGGAKRACSAAFRAAREE